MIRILRNIGVHLWITALFFIPLGFYLISGITKIFPDINPIGPLWVMMAGFILLLGFLMDMAGKKIVAFSGIAGNDHFRKTLYEFKCDLLEFIGFPDHHRYTAGDIERISKSVRDRKADFVMTTEKDFARMGGKFGFPVDLIVVGVKMCLKDEKAFRDFILSKL